MDCIALISTFLESVDIQKDSYSSAVTKVSKLSLPDTADIEFTSGEQIIYKILVDVYFLNAQNVKKCANVIAKKYGAIGRYEKDLIKHFLDYGDSDSFNALLLSLKPLNITEDTLSEILNSVSEELSNQALHAFISNWNAAEENDDESKKFDYIQGVYTRLVSILNADVLSLNDIYAYNEKFIKEELAPDSIDELKAFCSSRDKIPSKDARKMFCDKYESLLAKELQKASQSGCLEPVMNYSSACGTPFVRFNAEEFKLIAISIDQRLYDTSKSENDFWDQVLSLIYHSYRLLDNHRTLAVNIGNIFTADGRNLKWMAYSYIGIYAEHFIPTKEKRKFYRCEELCFEKCEYIGLSLTDEARNLIKKYYLGSASASNVANALNCSEETAKSVLLDFENVWYGYTFSDCLSVISGEYRQNEEIPFIQNNNQLVLIFNKYRHDDRKIPCPECAGLDISGNSFPEVGLRSWECKNHICPSRSKSNRGKRYSKKSNFMQSGFDYGTEHDLISRDLIKKWRRDVSVVSGENEIYEMLVRYFSFANEEVLFINAPASAHTTAKECCRKIDYIELNDICEMPCILNAFDSYFSNGGYVNRYLNQILHPVADVNESFTDALLESKSPVLVHGDSREVLSHLKAETITAAVTSPPYYNARLYSQWPNLYLYLSDMYEITKQIYRTMKKGGVYLYNIGDICGNENTVVCSNMGNKRILLGAYTIHIFTSAGFELLDNILWDKGEPQSNRQKNDGKFTPFYQKPMNVYEHMFLFKKPGAPAIVAPDLARKIPAGWDKNVVPFTPVIKINSKGENTLGHTAPFPEDIPNFVARVFTSCSDDIVLEPFAGSGTSLISAANNGVKALGIELCDEYVSLIENICADNNVNITRL